MKIKRGWQLFAAVIEVAIMAAVAAFGAVMIAVPVPLLLHFLSKYGVTGTPATMICRLAGVLLLIAGLWATRYLLATVESFVSRVNDDRPLLHGEGALFSRDAAFAKLNRVSQIRGPAHQKGGVGNQPIALATGRTDAPICDRARPRRS